MESGPPPGSGPKGAPTDIKIGSYVETLPRRQILYVRRDGFLGRAAALRLFLTLAHFCQGYRCFGYHFWRHAHVPISSGDRWRYYSAFLSGLPMFRLPFLEARTRLQNRVRHRQKGAGEVARAVPGDRTGRSLRSKGGCVRNPYGRAASLLASIRTPAVGPRLKPLLYRLHTISRGSSTRRRSWTPSALPKASVSKAT